MTSRQDMLLAEAFDEKKWALSGVPHAAFSELRETTPVARYEGGVVDPFWLITRHDDVAAIGKNPAQWLNQPRTTLGTKRGAEGRINSLPQMDGIQHTQHRRAIQAWFSPKCVRSLEARTKEVAKELVDNLAKKDTADIATELASEHSLWLICEILGIPHEEHDQLHRMAKALFAPGDPDLARQEQEMSLDDVVDYCKIVVDRRRKNPGDDLVSAVLAMQPGDRPISEHEILSHLLVLVSAGHDTTASAVAGGALAFIQNPRELHKVQEHPQNIGKAVEEIIRYVSPTTSFMRTAVDDFELHGEKIKAGDDVCLHFATANRDPRVFSNPDEFICDRTPNRHVGFGVGAHLCVGQMLAKSEMRSLFNELIPRIKTLELNGDPKWMQAIWISALKTLPVKYEIST